MIHLSGSNPVRGRRHFRHQLLPHPLPSVPFTQYLEEATQIADYLARVFLRKRSV
jgi:hypothetical protein